MKTFCSHSPFKSWEAVRGAVVACLLFLGATFSPGATLISCSGDPGGDFTYRGFYVPNYPGLSLDSARLVFSSTAVGNYTVTLTARRGAYDGPLIGSATETFSLSGVFPQGKAVTFNFASPAVPKGAIVCFKMTIVSSPSGILYYAVSDSSDGCNEVIETTGTTPPLDSFRGNGVNVVIEGKNSLLVYPGQSIQTAIDTAVVGETVFVKPGIYTENIHLRSGVDVVGAGSTATTLRGLGDTNVVRADDVTDARMEGFTITRSGTASYHAGVYIDGGSVQINNNSITGNINGIRIVGGSSAIIRNNVIAKNGSDADAYLNYGLICLASTPLIANNLIVSNSGAGLYFAWAESSGAQVINNTVVDNHDEGIWCYYEANVILKNNISKGNSTGISATYDAVPICSFNDVWGNRWLNYQPYAGGVAAPGPGDISVDPLFVSSASPPFLLGYGSPCINAGDPSPLYNDLDGSRSDMGAFGGPSGFLPGANAVTSGFLFNNVGKIPTSEITKIGPQAGLANVSAMVAEKLYIYPHKDAPFGGSLWIHGLFGADDSVVKYYRIYAAKWNGNSPPAVGDFQPVSDPLSKIKYTINASGVVTWTLQNIGPDSSGMYLRTDSGYWAHPDLKLVWNTLQLEDGKYDLICKAYDLLRNEVVLPANSLSRITLWVNNQPVKTEILSVRDRFGHVIPECGMIQLASATENLQFEFTASHAGGFLRDYSLGAVYGKNHGGGAVAADQYVGVHDSTPPLWSGVTATISNSSPAHASLALVPWNTCAYQFTLTAWARTTDGFSHLYWDTFSDHYYLNVGAVIPTTCVADLDGDGDVDGADLAIMAAQFGRTNCVLHAAP